MTSNAITLAAAVGLCAILGACATRGPETKVGMMQKASAMECPKMAGTPEPDEGDRRQDGPQGKRMMRAGCAMMTAKTGKAEQPLPGAAPSKETDPHADHRP